MTAIVLSTNVAHPQRDPGGAKRVSGIDKRPVPSEELDHWEREFGRELPDGILGENLTTRGIDLSRLLRNQRLRAGTAELEVSVARTPCRTFVRWLDEPGWIRRFNARERSGAYFRVVTPGTVTAGDELMLLDAPDHGVDMLTVFRGAAHRRCTLPARAVPPTDGAAARPGPEVGREALWS